MTASERIKRIQQYSDDGCFAPLCDVIYLLRAFRVMRKMAADYSDGAYFDDFLNTEFERRMGGEK